MAQENALNFPPSSQEGEVLSRSTKKSKRKITHLIVNHENDVNDNSSNPNHINSQIVPS